MAANEEKTRKSISRLKIIGIVFLVSLCGVQAYRWYWPKAVLRVGNSQLHVLVADNAYRHYKGLGGKKTLSPYDGMLFIFPTANKYPFVMRNTLFPLDIIWFNNGTVIDIAAQVPTEIGVKEKDLRPYYPRKSANMVLEVPAGWAQLHGVVIGSTMQVVRDLDSP
jgi:uncharacterized membrane protein (UPF0127 family)